MDAVQVSWCTAASCFTAVSQEDRAYILQALELAKRALGQTYPNPAVGCVIVKDGQVRVGVVLQHCCSLLA
jgi:tRNA(Arg) A34 adenosine deaminase TadA